MSEKQPEKTYDESTRQEELWNTISHGIGIPIGLLALGLLIREAIHKQSSVYLIAVLVYGITFIWTYTTSTLYHLAHNASVRVRNFLHLLDHTAIYLFIAGTYTPVAIFALPEIWNMGILIGIWTLALGGILVKIFSIGKWRKLSLVFYLLMGWMIVLAAKPLLDFAPMPLIYWMLAGGAFYTLGTIFFSWHSLKYGHAIWHVFVLGGSICHFYAIYEYLPGLIF